MNATLTSVKNPVWGDEAHTYIDCIITLSHLGDEELPFTASPNDVEEHGRVIFTDLVAGKYGSIGEFVNGY